MKNYLHYATLLLALAASCWLFPGKLTAQTGITLTGNQYLQDFDNLASGLPAGWSVYTQATASSKGVSVSAGTQKIVWNNTSGGFKNFASSTGLAAASTTTNQSSSTNRALGVRQVGNTSSTFPGSDPGAAFLFEIANTSGLKDFKLSFKLMSLDGGSPRTTSWTIQYGILTNGNYHFENIGTAYPIGGGSWTTTEVNLDFEDKLDNKEEGVCIRIVALSGSTGSGNRASTGIDDFTLTYSEINTDEPALTLSPRSLAGLTYHVGEGPSAAQAYQLQGVNLPDEEGSIVVSAPSSFEISLQNDGPFSSALLIPYADGTLPSQTLFVRLKAGLSTGSYANERVTHGIGDLAADVTVSGAVTDPNSPCGAVSVPIADARAYSEGSVVTITGRITALTVANHNIYLKDGDGPSDGMLVFDNQALRPADLVVGDEVQITGTRELYRGMVQLSSVTCFERVSNSPSTVEPVTITSNELCDYQGQLVTISGVSFVGAGDRLAGNTTYTLSDGTVVYIHTNTGIGGSTVPSGPTSITGVVTIFNSVCQLTPRFTADIQGSAPPASCGLPLAEVTNDERQLEVVNWNVEWLGHTSNGTGAAQLTNVLNGVRSMQADVYLLQEVCSYNAANPSDPTTALGAIIQALNSEFPTRDYTGECSPAYSYSYTSTPDAQGQRLCIVYRADQVKKVSSKPLMQDIYDQGVANYPTGSSSQFWASGRLPFMLEADVVIDGFKPARVHFVTLHSKANTGDLLESYRRRQYDHKLLYNYLQTEYPSASIIMAGDFNDDFDQSIYQYGSQNISSWSPFLYADPEETNIQGARPNANWNALTYKFSGTGCSSSYGFSTFIDHVIVSNEIALASSAGRVSAAGDFMVSAVETIRGTVSSGTGRASDHYPTFTRYQLSTALPVKLVNVEVRADENQLARISWSTAQEANSSYFEVERSVDGETFTAIGRVKGAGNTEKLVSYSFTDANPGEGVRYYRLKMVDADGTYEFSQLVSIRLAADVHVFPNPTAEVIELKGVPSGSNWVLYGTNGAAIKKGTARIVDLSDLAEGMYVIRIEMEEGVWLSRKVLKF